MFFLASSAVFSDDMTRKFMGRALACGELMRRKAVSFVGVDDSLQYQYGAKAANEFDARPVDCSAREP
jgi:hypothetical protein